MIDFITNLCVCVLVPIVITVHTVRYVKTYSAEKKFSWKNDVRPLPRQRKRRLTQPCLERPNLDCALLTKLPPELRRHIFEFVLGGNICHLVQLPRRIAHIRCHKSHFPPLRRCRIVRGTALHPHRSVTNGNTALLKTCRQIYNEAVPLLYTTNTFDVNDLHTFLFFMGSVLPHRLASIATLHVCWDLACNLHRHGLGDGEQLWIRFWRTVAAKMLGLQELRLRLRKGSLRVKMEAQEQWVRSVCEVKGLKRIVIEFERVDKDDAAAQELITHLEMVMLRKEG